MNAPLGLEESAMATRIGTEKNPVTMLEHLMALDFDAIKAYEAAIERLDSARYQAQLASFRADHERHVQELEPIIRAMGGKPPRGSDFKGLLTKGKVVLADMRGDEAILKAMKSNEDDTNTAYERALAHAPVEARDVLQRGLEDERRHRSWIVATLEGRSLETGRVEQPRPGERPPM